MERLIIIFIFLLLSFFNTSKIIAENDLQGKFTTIKILDKISSKNNQIKLINGEESK